MLDLSNTPQKILSFRDNRNCKQFHTPRNLAAGLSIEVSELQETMLWKTDEQVRQLLKSSERAAAVAAELGDILVFALLFCDANGIDPVRAIAVVLLQTRPRGQFC